MLNFELTRFRLGFQWRSILAQNPRLYTAWAGLRQPSLTLGISRRTTDLVLEGYPRSGNTFAWIALMMAQTCPLNVAHHSHNPARVIQAVRNHIPTLVLIREPKDCVISYSIYEPRLTIKLCFVHWMRFYKSIRPYLDGYVLATFEEVINDFGKVITKVNNKFDTQFIPFTHSKENVQQVLSNIEFKTTMLSKRADLNGEIEDQISKPSSIRLDKKYALEQELQKDAKLISLSNKAQNLYDSMLKR